MRKLILSMILVAGMVTPLAAQDHVEKLVLDLQGAVDHAISYNKSLKNARMEVDRSRASVWETIAQGLPQVDGAVDYMTYFNYELSFSFGGTDPSDITPDMIADATSQTLALFTNTTQQDLINHTAGNYFDNTLQGMLPPTTILMSDQSTAKLQISQLIFSGQYISGIQAAKLARIISEQNLEFNELNIKESVINSYYLVLITQESLRILEQNVENLNETLEQTRTMFNTGMAEQTDVDQIRITVNQLENSRNALARNLELSYNMLRFQLGVEPTVDLELSDQLESLFFSMEPESALAAAFNIEDNVTYQLMKSQEAINEKLMAIEQWNYAPTLAGFYNYNAKLLTPGFDMTPNHLAGLSLAVPIFSSGMRKARVDQARIDYDVAQNNRVIMEDQLYLQEKQFRYNLQNSLENHFTQKENVAVAQRVYDSYRHKFDQGMATSLDLTQANGNYLEAEANYMTSLLEVMNAKLALDKLMNKL
ncbi:MAG: TolC family protein [Bacteroidota bacterium]